MSSSNFVFLDPNGRRWFWVRAGVLASLTAFVGLILLFIEALSTRPTLPVPERVRSMDVTLRGLDHPSIRPGQPDAPWLQYAQAAKPGAAPANHPGRPVCAALLGDWSERSRRSFLDHAWQLTHICPELLTVSGQPAHLEAAEEPAMLAALRAARLRIVPVLSNLVGKTWDTDAVEGLLLSEDSVREDFILDLTRQLRDYGASGVLLDWQGIDPAFADKLAQFLGEMRAELAREDLELWLSIPVGDDLRAFNLELLPNAVDYFVAQLHDENAEDSTPGPIASQPWFEGWLKTLTSFGSPDQWILSLGSYGYDWNNATGETETLSFADIMARAGKADVEPATSSRPLFNPGFSYASGGESHDVWFLDATTFANQMGTAAPRHCAGLLVNRIGLEDPGVWKVIENTQANRRRTDGLHEIDPEESLAQIGEGDFLRVDLDAAAGWRTVRQEPDGLLATTYASWPSYPMVLHFGAGQPGQVALTFDDGPDPEWTPKILDVLKSRGVHATFFILGKNAEKYPELVRRIIREGHELGSHTYTHANLAEAGSEQTTLELNAVQRLLEWIAHRGTILFRPPYIADSMPSAMADARPIALAGDLGYVTVGTSIDPKDWERPGAAEIVRRVKAGRDSGNVLLLHDAGGDRSETVAALPRILDYLDERGDSVVAAGELLGLPREQTMPRIVEPGPSVPRIVSNAGLFLVRGSSDLLWTLLVVASVLTILRSAVIALLALRRKPSAASPDFTPPLSIVIAAFNEEKVISATLRALLRTTYRGFLEVIVVDDGSRDDTAREAEEIADPRVRVIRRANGGKSRALATGISAASGEIVVFLDADTQFQPDTLEELVAPLADPRVGAVSGHARVGNPRNWLTRFQSLEYICSFNIDRRAYDCVNAITVAPGAVSAYRRAAMESAGGIMADTLAEDTDLTLALHRTGWRVTYAPKAIAWTEAPESVGGLLRQRFRWAFGTMQCLWKHRDLILNPRRGALGCFSLPSIVFFQVILVATIPAVDGLLLLSMFSGEGLFILGYFLAFLLCDLTLAALACRLEREPLSRALAVIPMRALYRPLLSFVVWRALIEMLRGAWVDWGKLERKGSVAIPALP